MSTTDYSDDSQDHRDDSQGVSLSERESPGYDTYPTYLTTISTEPKPPLMLTPPAEAIEDGLTLTEISAAYGLSLSTLRRLLAKDKHGNPPKLRGTKVSIPTGRQYRILPSDMEALGYTAKNTVSGLVVNTARANLEAETLAARVRDLETSLQVNAALLIAKTNEVELLQQNNQDLRDAVASLAILSAPTPRRHWWRK